MRQAAQEAQVAVWFDRPGKDYGALVALDGAAFAVGRGECSPPLVPVGAGKTTTIDVLCRPLLGP